MLAELVVMQTAQKARIAVEPVSGTAHLIKVMTAIAGRGLLLGPVLRAMCSSSRLSSVTLASSS
jgi:hypothetical protein